MTLEKLKKIVNIIKLTRWLVVGVILAVLFWHPIFRIFKKLPKIFVKSESITLAGLSVKVKNKMTVKPTATFNEAIHGLNANLLLDVAELKGDSVKYSRNYTCNEGIYLDEIQFLEERGLVYLIDNNKEIPNSSGLAKSYTYKATPLGARSGKIMRSLIKVFIDQITAVPDTSHKKVTTKKQI